MGLRAGDADVGAVDAAQKAMIVSVQNGAILVNGIYLGTVTPVIVAANSPQASAP